MRTPDQPSSFGQRVRECRKRLGIGLREFCVEVGIDPAYLSRIERDIIPPPQDQDRLEALAKALGLSADSDQWSEFMDHASIAAGKIPQDMRDDAKVLKKLPVLFRTVRGERLDAPRLRALIEFLRDK